MTKNEMQRLLNDYKEALIWCSGSEDFQEGGKAREGWLKICKSLLDKKVWQL
jgi:hypothetical protein